MVRVVEEGGQANSGFAVIRYWRHSAIGLLWLAIYFDVIRRLVDDWRVDENYSHGFLVPLVSVYAIWLMRDRLRAEPLRPNALAGFLLLLLAMLMLFSGTIAAELYLTRLSLVLSLLSLTLYFAGWLWVRLLIFPIGLLLLALPVPAIIFNRVALPLQLIASDYATRMIRLFGVPALREGNVIELAQMKLQVVEACSGIRSLVSMTTLSVIFAYFFESRWRRRLILFLLVVPVAIFANAVRVAGTGILAHYRGVQAAEGFLHAFAGWMVFLLEMALLAGVYALTGLVLRSIRAMRGKSG